MQWYKCSHYCSVIVLLFVPLKLRALASTSVVRTELYQKMPRAECD